MAAAGATSAALIGGSIGVSAGELKNPLLHIKRQLMNSADQTETGVEVEVEYEVDWYVERRWSWVATTAKGRDFPT